MTICSGTMTKKTLNSVCGLPSSFSVQQVCAKLCEEQDIVFTLKMIIVYRGGKHNDKLFEYSFNIMASAIKERSGTFLIFPELADETESWGPSGDLCSTF